MGFQKVLLGILVLVAVIGGVYVFGSFSKNPINTAGVINDVAEIPEETAVTENVIEITSSGFSPSPLTISSGETVTFINKDTEKHWPASAMHPTHTNYPGVDYEGPGSYAGSSACISEGVAKTGAFDSCRELSQGESWSFTFEEIGTWGYHDHLNTGLFGKIIVE